MNMKTKDRRRSGWVTPGLTVPKPVAREEHLDNNLDFWDDWNDHRDGLRGSPDKTLLRPENHWFSDWWDVRRWNQKIKTQLKIRRARKK